MPVIDASVKTALTIENPIADGGRAERGINPRPICKPGE